MRQLSKNIVLSRRSPLKDILHYCVLTPREDRNKNFNESLCTLFQTYPYFKSLLHDNKKYGHLMFYSIIKNLIFKEYKKGEPICKCNDVISSMLILISGTANVYKPPQKFKKKPSQEGEGMTKFKFLLKNLFSAGLTKEFDHCVYQGNVLGLEDISKVKKRPRLIEAKTDCIVGELPLTDYTLIFERTQLLEKTSISYFLENLKLFKNVKKRFINKFQDWLTKSCYNKGESVVKKGQPYKTIYIIRKGMFQVTLRTTKKYINTIDLNCFNSSQREELERFSTQRKFELKNSYEEECEYKIVNLGFGEMFGQIEYKLGLSSYFFDVKCDEDNSEILEIDFERFTKESTKYFLDIFDKETTNQMIFFQNRINHIKNVDKSKGNQNKYISTILHHIEKTRPVSESKTEPKTETYPFTPKKKRYNRVKYKLCLNRIGSADFNSYRNTDFLSTQYTTQTPNKTNSKMFSFTNRENQKRNKEHHLSNLKSEVIRPYTSKCSQSSDTKSKFMYMSMASGSTMEKTKSNLMSFFSPVKSKENLIVLPMTENRLLHENNKDKYCKCFEVNKKFFLKNNTSILSHKLSSIFVNK